MLKNIRCTTLWNDFTNTNSIRKIIPERCTVYIILIILELEFIGAKTPSYYDEREQYKTYQQLSWTAKSLKQF